MMYFETSVKTGENVERVFKTLGEMLYKKHKQWNSKPDEKSQTSKDDTTSCTII